MARKARTPVPDDETKAQKFVRLGKVRMTAFIKSARLIGQLSGSGYENTPEQLAVMKTAAVKAVNDAFAKFEGKSDSDATFNF